MMSDPVYSDTPLTAEREDIATQHHKSMNSKELSKNHTAQRASLRDETAVWVRISAFLSRKAPTSRATYVGVISEWTHFLGAEVGTGNGAAALCRASDIDALGYLSWLQKQPGQRSRFTSEDIRRADVATTTHGFTAPNDGTSSLQANRTIAKKASILRRVYTMLIGAGLVTGVNPFDKDLVPPPPADSGQKRPTNMIDFDRVMAFVEAPDATTPKGLRDRAILSLLFGGGLRRGEVVSLRLGDIQRSTSGTLYIHLRNTKGKRDAFQPLPPWGETHLLSWLEVRHAETTEPGAWLFTSFTGKGGSVLTGRPLTASGLYQLFRRYATQIGAGSEVTPHSARATAITQLLESGLSHRSVQEFSRHQSVTMVEVYDKRRRQVEDNPGRTLTFARKKKKKRKN